MGGSEEDLQLMDQRKRKRMLSNREAAKRSRVRKQMHLDDLEAQTARVKEDNHLLLSAYNSVAQENALLRVQNETLIQIIAGNLQPLAGPSNCEGCDWVTNERMVNEVMDGNRGEETREHAEKLAGFAARSCNEGGDYWTDQSGGADGRSF